MIACEQLIQQRALGKCHWRASALPVYLASSQGKYIHPQVCAHFCTPWLDRARGIRVVPDYRIRCFKGSDEFYITQTTFRA
jgi:hypothetical protein